MNLTRPATNAPQNFGRSIILSPRSSPRVGWADSPRNHNASPVSDEEQDDVNFQNNSLTFFSAHRPVRLEPGQRVFAMRRVNSRSPTSSSFLLRDHGDDVFFEFVSGIVETVGSRLCWGTVMNTVEEEEIDSPGNDLVEVRCDIRCQRGNRVFVDRCMHDMNVGMNSTVTLSHFKRIGQTDETIVTDETHGQVNLNNGEISVERWSTEDGKESTFFFRAEAPVVKGTKIIVHLADSGACTVAYDDDYTNKPLSADEDTTDMDALDGLRVGHMHTLSEVMSNPAPSSTLGEIAAQFLAHPADERAGRGGEELHERMPTYGRILMLDAVEIIKRCEAEAHADQGVGVRPKDMSKMALEIRKKEWNKTVCRPRRNVTSQCGGGGGGGEVVEENEEEEKIQQCTLDLSSVEHAMRERGIVDEVIDDDDEDENDNPTSTQLLQHVWAEYSWLLVRQSYERRHQALSGSGGGNSSNGGGNGSNMLASTVGRLQSIAFALQRFLAGNWSRINCYRRESSAPLWNDRLLSSVPRPVRLAPAGTQIRCTSWHPIRHRIAIGTSDNSVYFHIPQLDDEEDE